MNDKEAIEILRRIDIKFFLCGMIEQNNYIVDEADKVNNAIETVLSILEEKDKIIDLMAEVICRLDTMNNYDTWNNDIQEVKQYFKNKAKEE